MTTYDYVVVGAGSAGCIAARRVRISTKSGPLPNRP